MEGDDVKWRKEWHVNGGDVLVGPGKRIIKPLAGGIFAIVQHEQWLPGLYDTEDAAKLAYEVDEAVLIQLQESVNPDGAITLEMLRGVMA